MLILGDCLEEMKKLKDDSVDLLFCDLPYNQTSCHWDCALDLSQFWLEVNRVCKDTTPMFFTCSTKFGVSLINSNPKNFRYDMVWVKSAPCGFLNAKKMPMKKHEMVYVFYRKLPMYDLSSHTHKFIKEVPTKRGTKDRGKDGEDTKGMIINRSKSEMETITKYEPALPTSILMEEPKLCQYDVDKNAYGGGKKGRIKISKKKEEHETRYEPSLPTTILREECSSMYGTEKGKIFIYDEDGKLRNSEPRYDPPLPTSVITTELYSQNGEPRELYRNEAGQYEPPLPNTVLRETDTKQCYNGNVTYNHEDREGAIYDPPLPCSVLKTEHETAYGTNVHFHQPEQRNGESIYDPPLPNTILEIKSEKGKHPTQKPIALIEWCLKYYSKEGDTVLDPTAGSGSTAIACRNLNRKYICIEKDPEIFKVMEKRLA